MKLKDSDSLKLTGTPWCGSDVICTLPSTRARQIAGEVPCRALSALAGAPTSASSPPSMSSPLGRFRAGHGSQRVDCLLDEVWTCACGAASVHQLAE
jgi:hypothetical protein